MFACVTMSRFGTAEVKLRSANSQSRSLARAGSDLISAIGVELITCHFCKTKVCAGVILTS